MTSLLARAVAEEWVRDPAHPDEEHPLDAEEREEERAELAALIDAHLAPFLEAMDNLLPYAVVWQPQYFEAAGEAAKRHVEQGQAALALLRPAEAKR